jgi:hypothetical protein
MSGPFVQETGYPWEGLRDTPILVTEGTNTPSLEASLLLADWLQTNDFLSHYLEVNADHGGMIPLVLPDVFDFLAAQAVFRAHPKIAKSFASGCERARRHTLRRRQADTPTPTTEVTASAE